MSHKHAGPRAGVEKFSSDGEKIFVTTIVVRGGAMSRKHAGL